MNNHILEKSASARAFVAQARAADNSNALAGYRRGVLDATGALPSWLERGKGGRPRAALDVARAIALWKQEESWASIARALDSSSTTVRRAVLRAIGVL
ncbi:hypothetical protein ACIPRI_23165 [Variovorax sp. LARHSF232]